MLKKNCRSLLLLLVLVSGSMILQGCAVVGVLGSLVSGIGGVLGSSSAMGGIGSALGAAGGIAGMFGNNDVAGTLGQAGQVVQAIPGAVQGVQNTVQGVQGAFQGQGQTTAGTLQSDGSFTNTADTAQQAVNTNLQNATAVMNENNSRTTTRNLDR